MKKRQSISILLGLLAASGAFAAQPVPSASPTPSPSASASLIDGVAQHMKLPAPEIETLPNGLQIAWFVNDQLPVVDIGFLFNSGTRDDLPGKSGTAELVASALDRGAGGMSAQEIARTVEALGASRYATATEDGFAVGMHGLAPDAPALLDLLAKLVLQPEFKADEVSREHARMLDRWAHLPDYQESLVGLAFSRTLLAGTSYWRGGFLSADEFRKVGRDDVVRFHKTHFVPKNAMLMVVGRVDREAFKAKIHSLFGDWKGEAPKRDRRPFPVGTRLAKGPRPLRVLVIDRPNSTQAQVRFGFIAPGLKDPRHYSLSVANALLGEYFNSRLNALIRDELGLTYGIGSSFGYEKDLATFTISSATRTESVGQLIDKTLDVLKGLKKGPITEEEVKTSKEYLIGGFPLQMSTLGAVASRWVTGYFFNLGPDYLNEFLPSVEAVKTSQVQSAVKSAFPLDQWVIAVAGDAPGIEKSLKAQGIPYHRVSVKDLMAGKGKF